MTSIRRPGKFCGFDAVFNDHSPARTTVQCMRVSMLCAQFVKSQSSRPGLTDSCDRTKTLHMRIFTRNFVEISFNCFCKMFGIKWLCRDCATSAVGLLALDLLYEINLKQDQSLTSLTSLLCISDGKLSACCPRCLSRLSFTKQCAKRHCDV